MSNTSWGEPIEDYSAIALQSDRATGLVETGYGFPGELGRFDQLFSLRTSRAYVVVRSDDVIEITDAETFQVEVLAHAYRQFQVVSSVRRRIHRAVSAGPAAGGGPGRPLRRDARDRRGLRGQRATRTHLK